MTDLAIEDTVLGTHPRAVKAATKPSRCIQVCTLITESLKRPIANFVFPLACTCLPINVAIADHEFSRQQFVAGASDWSTRCELIC